MHRSLLRISTGLVQQQPSDLKAIGLEGNTSSGRVDFIAGIPDIRGGCQVVCAGLVAGDAEMPPLMCPQTCGGAGILRMVDTSRNFCNRTHDCKLIDIRTVLSRERSFIAFHTLRVRKA